MIRSLLYSIATLFRSRTESAIEILALRQQLAVFKAFWIAMRRWWPNWQRALLIVRPETVVNWHRQGFRTFWRWRSRPQRQGRPRIEPDIRQFIRTMAKENPTWGAPKIHAELQMLGIEISESTVSK